MHRVLHLNSLEEWVTEVIFGMMLLKLSFRTFLLYHHKQILPFCITLKQYSVWEWTSSQPWRWYKTYGERKLQHNGNDSWEPHHPDPLAHPNRNARLSWFGQCFGWDLWGNLQGCWRKWWQQHCRWYSLLLSHHWVNSLCDESQQGFLEELWAWCEVMVLSVRNYLKTIMNFVWGADLVTLGTWSHFSISLSFIISPHRCSISSSLGQENKTGNAMPGWWSTEKHPNSIERDFYSNPVINLNDIWITSRALSTEGLWQG